MGELTLRGKSCAPRQGSSLGKLQKYAMNGVSFKNFKVTFILTLITPSKVKSMIPYSYPRLDNAIKSQINDTIFYPP